MASIELYPPLIDSSMPAFVVNDSTFNSNGNGVCKIFFKPSTLSKVPLEQIKGIHVSIIKQSTGKSVINPNNNMIDKRYRSTGILLYNTTLDKLLVNKNENLYCFTIASEDVRDNKFGSGNIGWAQSEIYKVQIRFSTEEYPPTVDSPTKWLVQNGPKFSEWSTICIIKSIPKPNIECSLFSTNSTTIDYKPYNSTVLEYIGKYSNEDTNESLYSYSFKLYDYITGNLIEETKELFPTNKDTLNGVSNNLYYLFNTELKDEKAYTLKLFYKTKNNYENSVTYFYKVSTDSENKPAFKIITADNSTLLDFTVAQEEDDGRIGLKLIPDVPDFKYSGDIYIKRANSRNNFSTWEDIKVINCNNTLIADIPIIYDYTAESGIWYKYGVQTSYENNKRSDLRYDEDDKKTLREFNFSYLLGENNKQLKLKFNNEINNYKYNYSESVTKTLGGAYPYIARSGHSKYRQFPINGLISFEMDDNNLFLTDKELYVYDEIIQLYKERDNHTAVYNYTLERDFRDKVIEFLQDGKAKLFKSSTEGNIIIRITDISLSPERSLNRLIASFSGTAYEIADASIENYKKYNFV